jgi:hypothetical protein
VADAALTAALVAAIKAGQWERADVLYDLIRRGASNGSTVVSLAVRRGVRA